MQEFPKSDRPSKGGRRPFVPSQAQRDKTMLLAAASFSEPQIAIAIGCCQNTLRKCLGQELKNGRTIKKAELLERLELASRKGSISATRTLMQAFDRGEHRQPLDGKPEARPSKRTLAARAAATAGGAGTPWGSDLDWSNGRRPQ